MFMQIICGTEFIFNWKDIIKIKEANPHFKKKKYKCMYKQNDLKYIMQDLRLEPLQEQDKKNPKPGLECLYHMQGTYLAF